MSQEPKVLFVINSLSGGGAEKSSRQIFGELAKNGLDLQLIALNKMADEKISRDPRETVLERNWKDGISSTIKNYLFFVKKVKEFKPSVIVVHCELPELYVAFLPIFKVEVVVVEVVVLVSVGHRQSVVVVVEVVGVVVVVAPEVVVVVVVVP